jgi:glycosyltransferase involved in cell wall biosynthesis
MKPKFSIIIPALNEELFLSNLLRSLSKQTFSSFEVVVSDGASSDKTVAVAESFRKKLRSLTIVKNSRAGLCYQRNRGADNAQGKWYFFIDADSVLLPHALERMNEYIENANVDHFTPWYVPDSAKSGDAILTLVINTAMEMAAKAKKPAAFGPISVMSKKAYDNVGGYDESLTWGEDGDISRRIVKAGFNFGILRETLIEYSLRRFRKKGTLRTLQLYARASFYVLLTNKSPKVPNYIMGGHFYNQEREHLPPSMFKKLQRNIEKITKEIFA